MTFTKWSSHVWQVLHNMSFGDFQKREVVIEFIEYLPKVMDCKLCKKHYIEYINSNNPRDSDDLFKWTVDLHNHVNKKLNKKLWTLDEATEKYKWTFL
jgi:hypothetical protein